MAGVYNYKWYMSLTYDQWARSTVWVLNSMQKDLASGELTRAQWDAIMKRRSGLYQEKIDAALSKGTVIAQASGGHIGSASLPPDKSFWDKIGDAMVFPGIKTAADNVVNAVSVVGGGAGKTLLFVGGAVLLALILRR